MKNKNLIKKKYLNKIKELQEHNQQYYEKSKPKITDGEYDKLKKEGLVETAKTEEEFIKMHTEDNSDAP